MCSLFLNRLGWLQEQVVARGFVPLDYWIYCW